jgi:N-acetylmuramoyl-L-alanine amidase
MRLENNIKGILGAVFIGILLFVIACNSNRYAKTNKIYTEQVKQVTELIRQPLPTPERRIYVEVADPKPAVPPAGKVMIADNVGVRNDLQWVGAIHFDLRRPNFVIIHHTAQDSVEQTLKTFTAPHTEVSTHYLIGRNGEIFQMLNDYLRGWHAGQSKWGSLTDLNSISLGIELDNNGKEPFPEVQISSLLSLLDSVKRVYKIPTANFLGHADIAPTRKQDPSIHFPWKQLAEHGFGLWPDSVLVTPPANFNPMDALRVIGYDVRNPQAAILAFKRKFIVNDLKPELTLYDQTVLYNLYQKY